LAGWRDAAEHGVLGEVEALHPSWMEESIAAEHAPVGRAARERAGGPSRDLARLVFGRLAPMWESRGGVHADELCQLGPAELVEEIRRRGARTVGLSLARAPRELCARAMAAAGETWAQIIAEAAQAAVSDGERKAARSVAAAATTNASGSTEDRLLQVGLLALRAELLAEGQGSVFRVAGRLPSQLGRRLLGW
jgi:hypothetical protein